eukprot:Lankesteria_metandrocarpae@DN8955_c0_g1_i1.p1
MITINHPNEVSHLVDVLVSHSDVKAKQEANALLLQFQQSPQAWNISLEILIHHHLPTASSTAASHHEPSRSTHTSPYNLTVRFTAAQAILMKCRNELDLLGDGVWQQLKAAFPKVLIDDTWLPSAAHWCE